MSFTVLTWNIGLHHWNGYFMDNRCRDANIEFISSLIDTHGPDIISLQELKGKIQLRRIEEHLGRDYTVESSPEDFFHRSLGMLIKKGIKYEFHIVHAQNRPILCMETKNLYYFAVHLHAFLPWIRIQQIEIILEFLKRRPKKEVIIAGDFNLYSLFKETIVLKKDKKLYTMLKNMYLDVGEKKGNTAFMGIARGDYIFTSKKPEDIIDYKIIRARGRFMDHYPLVCSIKGEL